MTHPIPDVIDFLVGPPPGLGPIRAKRAQARENAQKSFEALFSPQDAGTVSLEERLAVATFVAGLHRDAAIAAFYGDRLAPIARPGLAAAIAEESRKAATEGPYGNYPEGPLSKENEPGLIYKAGARDVFGARLAAGLEHAHLLVFRPRDASPEALQKLLDAGWSATDIVTLSQLVAFLAFQIRVVTGFRALAAAQKTQTAAA